MKDTKQMSAAKYAAGAVSHEGQEWHATNWQAVHRNVSRLQARIVKATQEQRWGKVKALQRLLTRSFSAKALAVRRVTENQGKNTPGVDGITWNTPQQKMQAVYSLKQHGYRPLPLRRIDGPTSNGKRRPLSIPTMHDRAMQAVYLQAIDPVAETLADPNSYGCRQERSCTDAMTQCHICLSQDSSAEWVLAGTVCFDTLSHDWLLRHAPMEKTILKQWLKAGYINKYVLTPMDDGVPQGRLVAPVLANLMLDGLETVLREHFPKRSRQKVNVIRFADKFVITGATREVLETHVKPLVETFLQERGLRLAPAKTVVTHIEDGFDFLGQHVRKYNGQLLIKPSKQHVHEFLTTIRETLKSHKQLSVANLIHMLNPKLRAWVNFHRHVASKATFKYVDSAIFQALWQWAKRRHPHKPRQWIRHKYFLTVGSDNWVFATQMTHPDGYQSILSLIKASDTPIRRQPKIHGAANPYDPVWEHYFEARLGLIMADNLHGRKTLLYLWKRQQGTCPVCQQKITTITGWHNHHITWRSRGGAHTVDNRILLHPNCHRQLHAKSLTVVLPHP